MFRNLRQRWRDWWHPIKWWWYNTRKENMLKRLLRLEVGQSALFLRVDTDLQSNWLRANEKIETLQEEIRDLRAELKALKDNWKLP